MHCAIHWNSCQSLTGNNVVHREKVSVPFLLFFYYERAIQFRENRHYSRLHVKLSSSSLCLQPAVALPCWSFSMVFQGILPRTSRLFRIKIKTSWKHCRLEFGKMDKQDVRVEIQSCCARLMDNKNHYIFTLKELQTHSAWIILSKAYYFRPAVTAAPN